MLRWQCHYSSKNIIATNSSNISWHNKNLPSFNYTFHPFTTNSSHNHVHLINTRFNPSSNYFSRVENHKLFTVSQRYIQGLKYNHFDPTEQLQQQKQQKIKAKQKFNQFYYKNKIHTQEQKSDRSNDNTNHNNSNENNQNNTGDSSSGIQEPLTARERNPILWKLLVLLNLIALVLVSFLDWRTTIEHFSLRFANLSDNRLHTLITTAFTHFEPIPALINIMCICTAGPVVEAALGGYRLFIIYMAGSLLASLVFLAEAHWRGEGSPASWRAVRHRIHVPEQDQESKDQKETSPRIHALPPPPAGVDRYGVPGSGAVGALVGSAATLLRPVNSIRMLGVVPVNPIALAVVYGVTEAAYMHLSGNTSVSGNAAHVVGMAAGFGYVRVLSRVWARWL